jgi:uncharacterized protein CbrC (UPF0167 family)
MTPRQQLEGARDLIADGGTVSSLYHGPEGSYCFIGALYKTIESDLESEHPRCFELGPNIYRQQIRQSDAYHYLSQALGSDAEEALIRRWPGYHVPAPKWVGEAFDKAITLAARAEGDISHLDFPTRVQRVSQKVQEVLPIA